MRPAVGRPASHESADHIGGLAPWTLAGGTSRDVDWDLADRLLDDRDYDHIRVNVFDAEDLVYRYAVTAVEDAAGQSSSSSFASSADPGASPTDRSVPKDGTTSRSLRSYQPEIP